MTILYLKGKNKFKLIIIIISLSLCKHHTIEYEYSSIHS
jgi:hypothetical protein